MMSIEHLQKEVLATEAPKELTMTDGVSFVAS